MPKYETKHPAPGIIKQLSISDLLKAFEKSGEDNKCTQATAIFRGWIMDELEARNPEAFNLWLDQDSPEDADLRRYMEGAY
jgi:hypothetical protein